MQAIKLTAVILVGFALSGCLATGGGTQADAGQQQAQPSVFGMVLQQRVQQKGPDMFCSQPTYTKCLGVDAAQCNTELSAVKDRCFEVAQAQSGEGVSSTLFATHYASCMTVNHGLMHPERATEIKACVQDADFDYAAMLRAVLY